MILRVLVQNQTHRVRSDELTFVEAPGEGWPRRYVLTHPDLPLNLNTWLERRQVLALRYGAPLVYLVSINQHRGGVLACERHLSLSQASQWALDWLRAH